MSRYLYQVPLWLQVQVPGKDVNRYTKFKDPGIQEAYSTFQKVLEEYGTMYCILQVEHKYAYCRKILRANYYYHTS